MSAHAIFAASWPLLYSGIFAPVQTGGVAVIVTLTVTAPKLLTFTHKLDLLTSWLWPMGGFGVDGRLLFVTFGTFVIVHLIPHVNSKKKALKKCKKKAKKRGRGREREAFAPVIYGFDYPRTQWANKGAGKVFALSKPSGKRLGSVSKLAIKQNAHASHSAGTFGGQGGALELLFSGRNLGIFRGSKAEHRNHRSSTRTCRKRLCVFSIVAIVYTRNNRRGCSGSLVGLKRLLVVVAHFQSK